MPRHEWTPEQARIAGEKGGKASGVTRWTTKQEDDYRRGYNSGYRSGVYSVLRKLRIQAREANESKGAVKDDE